MDSSPSQANYEHGERSDFCDFWFPSWDSITGYCPCLLPSQAPQGLVRANLHRRLGWILWQTSIVGSNRGSEVSPGGGIYTISTDT